MMAVRKGTAKLTELLEIEEAVQLQWETDHIFEQDAPEPGSEESKYGH